MSSNPYIPLAPAAIEQARQTDLLTYLRQNEPGNLKHVTGNVYCTADHDSLKISNGKWYWWSRGFGGYSALDYLIKVREYSFVEAVEALTASAAEWNQAPAARPRAQPKAEQRAEQKAGQESPKILLLPPRNRDCDQVSEYLFGRGIDYVLIQDCITDGILYESADYHNAVFIGRDETGTPKYAACRSTAGRFKGDAAGSDKSYSFRLLSKTVCPSVHVFEAAIDLLSYATYLKYEGRDYQSENLLSLSGVYQSRKEPGQSKIPVALTVFLKANPQITTIFLHLDNDKAGRLCTAALKEKLQKDYKIVDSPPPTGKDVNDFLLSYLGFPRQKSLHERTGDR